MKQGNIQQWLREQNRDHWRRVHWNYFRHVTPFLPLIGLPFLFVFASKLSWYWVIICTLVQTVVLLELLDYFHPFIPMIFR